jgi:hypothetical protein
VKIRILTMLPENTPRKPQVPGRRWDPRRRSWVSARAPGRQLGRLYRQVTPRGRAGAPHTPSARHPGGSGERILTRNTSWPRSLFTSGEGRKKSLLANFASSPVLHAGRYNQPPCGPPAASGPTEFAQSRITAQRTRQSLDGKLWRRRRWQREVLSELTPGTQLGILNRKSCLPNRALPVW